MDIKLRKDALDAYGKATQLIEGMFEVYQDFQKDKGKSFDVKDALVKFDVLLQFSMMQVALENNSLHIDEAKIIRDMSKYCDFCDYLNNNGFQNVTWQKVYDCKESSLQEIVTEHQDVMVKANMELVAMLMLFKGTENGVEFFESLKQLVFVILASVSASDGNFDKAEVTQQCLILQALAAAEQLAEEATGGKAEGEQSAEQPQGKKTSLKDFYVKKN